MNSNPYESPKAVEDEFPAAPKLRREKGIGSFVAMMAFTISGALLGDVAGNAAADFLGLLRYRNFGGGDYISIQHPLSLALLVLGGISGGVVSIRLTDRWAAMRIRD